MGIKYSIRRIDADILAEELTKKVIEFENILRDESGEENDNESITDIIFIEKTELEKKQRNILSELKHIMEKVKEGKKTTNYLIK